jgi:uncharacterized membrane protein
MEQTTQNTQSGSADKHVNKRKHIGMAVVAYILFFIPLLTKAKHDPFVKYHVKQGLVLFICSIIVSIVTKITFIGLIISPFLNLAIFVLFIIGVINALNGVEKPLPFVGHFADNFKF